MASPVPPATLTTFAVLVPLVLWRLYARFKRMVGRQHFSAGRLWFTLTIFPLIVVGLALSAGSTHPERLALLAAGLVLGVFLGRFGLAHTKFERSAEGLFYTPNAHLGIALTLLFIARIGFRFVELATMDFTHAQPGMDAFARSPWTLGIFGVLAGYYVSYAIGLLRWRRSVRDEPVTTS